MIRAVLNAFLRPPLCRNSLRDPALVGKCGGQGMEKGKAERLKWAWACGCVPFLVLRASW